MSGEAGLDGDREGLWEGPREGGRDLAGVRGGFEVVLSSVQH